MSQAFYPIADMRKSGFWEVKWFVLSHTINSWTVLLLIPGWCPVYQENTRWVNIILTKTSHRNNFCWKQHLCTYLSKKQHFLKLLDLCPYEKREELSREGRGSKFAGICKRAGWAICCIRLPSIKASDKNDWIPRGCLWKNVKSFNWKDLHTGHM